MSASLVLSLLWLTATDPELHREGVRYAAGDLQLAAELILPGSEDLLAGAVILQGSGDSDRRNPWARGIALTLADAGLAVLLTDKRGCGESEGDWREVGFRELAADALAGVAYLQDLPELDADRIGLVGLSQGGWVAPVAAARSRDVAFVITVSGAAVGFAEQVALEMTNTAREAGLSEAGIRQVLDLNHRAGRYALCGDWDSYSAGRSRAMKSELRPVAAGFPDTRTHPRWQFIRAVGWFDPMPYWMLVEQPTLVVYGAEDEQDNVPVQESVRRLRHAFTLTGKQNATVQVFPGVGHGIIEPGKSRLLPAFVDTLRRWIAANTGD